MPEDYSPDFESDEIEEDEYEEIEEEISSDEVDRVLESLSSLMEGVESEAVHEYLVQAYNSVFALIYEEEEDDDDEGNEELSIEIDDNFDDLTEAEAA
ncbi:MAG: hypothetical protein VB875_12240 [Pirellulales bacterium]